MTPPDLAIEREAGKPCYHPNLEIRHDDELWCDACDTFICSTDAAVAALTSHLSTIPGEREIERAIGQAQIDTLTGALGALVAKLDQINADPSMQSVFAMAAIRGAEYMGPTYERELEAAKAVLGDEHVRLPTYADGMRDMRERAAKVADSWRPNSAANGIASHIRSLALSREEGGRHAAA